MILGAQSSSLKKEEMGARYVPCLVTRGTGG